MRSQNRGRPTSRRALLQAFGGGGVAAVLAACGAKKPKPGPQAQGPAIVMIIRHAEKPAVNGTTPHGMTIDGNVDNDHSLAPAGWLRAGALTELFGSARTAPPAGLYKPTQFYASQGDTQSLRPLQTLTPLATRLGSFVVTKFSRTDIAALAAELRGQSGVSLVAWESDALPTIPPALGKITPAPPSVWPNDRFDMVWVFTSDNGSDWQFSQVPQLLLAGDRPDPLV